MSLLDYDTHTTPVAGLLDLTGKVAIVTGGAMGIGGAISKRLHEAGATVAIADLDAEVAGQLTATLNAARPGSAIAVHTDVGDPESVRHMVRDTVETLGGIDILVNNAGIYPFKTLAQIDWDTFMRVLEVNLGGVFECTKLAAAQMIAQGRGGRIVNVTSIDALHPSAAGLAHYDASKHGVWGFTKNIALELAEHHIWVNALAPGAIATPGTGFGDDAATDVPADTLEATVARIPMKRMGDPDEMARAVLFLASPMAGYMTGTQIVADGGLLLR